MQSNSQADPTAAISNSVSNASAFCCPYQEHSRERKWQGIGAHAKLWHFADEEPWSGIKDIVDETWYIDSDIDAAMERVLARQTGNGAPPEVAQRRVATNDRPNALQISATRERAHLVIPFLPLCSGS